MLQILHAQFLVLYAALPNKLEQAYNDALAQEAEVYQSANKFTYRNATSSCLTRLKKRPPAARKSEDYIGTLGEEAKRLLEKTEREANRLSRSKIAKYIAAVSVLEKYDYLVRVPESAGGDLPTREGTVTKCDRCGVEWLVKSNLAPVSFNRLGSPLLPSMTLIHSFV